MAKEGKKKNKLFLIIGIILGIFLVLCFIVGSDEDDEYDEDYSSSDSWSNDGDSNNNYDNYDKYPLGTAGELNGTNLLVTIFASDENMVWTESDANIMYDSLASQKIACDWLTSNLADYGCDAKFIYDWSQNEDLYYEVTLDCDFSNLDYGGVDEASWKYIDKNIDINGLMSKYNADNVLFMYMINSPKSNPATSATRAFFDGMPYAYECCYMYMFTEYEEETPAAFAHEMLHAYGAPDLYMADTSGDNYGITQEYVDMLERTQANDIMYTTYGNETNISYHDKITNDFTEIDAYYVGVTDHSSVVEEWGFDTSEHFR